MQATNGKLYGVTKSAWPNGEGIIYEYDITADSISNIVDLTYLPIEKWPSGKLIQAANGLLYGSTISFGDIFAYDIINDTVSKKSDFNYSTGRPSDMGYLTEIESNTGILKPKLQLIFDIFPNPTSGVINIKLASKYKDLNVNIYDKYGKLILSRNYYNLNLI